MLDRETFTQGPISVPWPVRGDAYTVSSCNIVSKHAKVKSVYNFTNRISPIEGLPKGVAKDGRMCLYGVTDFIQRELVKPITEMDVMTSELFMRDARIDGRPLDFDKSMWQRVVREYKGYLPIRIQALPEGSTFWANEPVIQVSSLEEGFGEVAAIIEGVMVGYVANATARLTLTRHLLERVRDVVRKHNPTYTQEQVDGVAQWMIHDFGMRASSTPQESEIYGRAHLLCFNGTDTFNGAFQAWANNAKRPIGTSILALAHRIVMGYGNESEAYEALFRVTKDSFGSYVGDCYSFHEAVRKFLVVIAKRAESTVIARPDSGDYLENILFVVEQAIKHDLYKMDEQNKPVATTLRFIQGDSMTWDKIQKAFTALEQKGVNPTQWGIFGIGGWLRNTPNRDTLSSAYKLCAAGKDTHPTIKLSDTLAKVSVPGPNVVIRPTSPYDIVGPTVYLQSEIKDGGDAFHNDNLQLFYDGSMRNIEAFGNYCLEDFNDHRNRVINEFDKYAYVAHDRGTPTNSPLSREILKLQRDTMRRYGKTVADYVF